MLARQPKEVARSADIVGGLPRVTEIFEARTPKDPAVTSLISGRIELYSDKRKGKITVRVISDADIEEDHHVPQGKHLLVQAGDMVQAGQPLTDGPLIPKDILDILGVEALYSYMLEEVQNVYRAQGVPISDKHIEVVLSAMLGKIEVNENGDTELLPHDVVDQYAFRAANEQIMKMVRIKEPGDTSFVTGDLVLKTKVKEANDAAEADGKTPAKSSRTKPASGKVLLLGITKASLQSESFLSGASFQETTKVLTEAALRGATDELQGLKENVLLGHLIPAGTGFEPYTKMRVRALVEPPADEFSDEEVMRTEAAHLAEVAGAEPATAMIIGSTPERDDAAEADAQEAIATGDPINVSDPLL